MLERVLSEWPSRRGLGVLLLVTLGATLAFVPVFLPLEKRLQAAGHGIVDFELAASAGHVDRILADWTDGEAIDEAVVSIQVDFAFLVAYSLLCASLVLWTARREVGTWRARGFALVPWCLAAGLFDSVENCFGLVNLHLLRGDALRAPLGASFAAAKFGILVLVLAFVVRGLVLRVARRGA